MKLRKTNVRTGGGQLLINKGFTLIELLAVIVILAIIAVIAVPIVLNIIKETKEKSYDISVENIVKAANLYDISSQLNDTTILMDQNIYNDLKNNLNGSVPDDGTVYLKSSITGEKREIAFALQYGEWCYTKAYGDPIYERKKTKECNVPVDYLFTDYNINFLDETTGPENLFLWREEDTTHAIKRNQIESLEIKPSDKVSESAIYGWDVSQDQTRKVMAWYEDTDNNGLYEVYIGQNGGVKAKGSSNNLFAHLSNATNIDLKYLDTSQVTSMQTMFWDSSNLISLDVSNFNTSKVTNMSAMFSGCNKLVQLDLSSFDTKAVKSMFRMFKNCTNLRVLDISSFKTPLVTNISEMFNGCNSVIELDLSGFSTEKVTIIREMFNGCRSLLKLDLRNFVISPSVDSFWRMFYNCTNLKELKIDNWDTSNVKNMNSMFNGCIALEELDVSKWNTSNVSGMNYLFGSCKSLTSLNLSNWNTNNVTDMAGMFSTTSNLTTITIGCDWVTSTNNTGMFSGSNYTLSNFNTLIEQVQATCTTTN